MLLKMQDYVRLKYKENIFLSDQFSLHFIPSNN